MRSRFTPLALLTLLLPCLLLSPPRASAQGPGAGSPAPFAPDGTMERDKVPAVYRWQLGPIFKDAAAFDAGLADAATGRQKLLAFKGRLSDPRALSECLDQYFKLRLLTNRLTMYANLSFNSDRKSTRNQEMNARALQAMSDLIDTASFIREALLAQTDAQLASALKAQPSLAAYRPYIDELRRRRSRVLPPAAERVLSLAGDILWAEIDLNELPSEFQKISQSLLTELPLPRIHDDKGREVQMTLSSYPRYRASKDRNVRRSAVAGLFGSLRSFQNTLASTFAGQVDFSIFLARARGYQTSLEAYLDKDDIRPDVYLNLVRTVRANLAPLHRYVKLRRQVMGVDRVHIYDLYTPLVPSVKMEIPFEEARKRVLEALAPLGKTYCDVLATGLDPRNGWIDVYPNKNKDSGASCTTVFGLHPYVLLNYYNELEDVSTLAHEFGHALHSHLSMTSQPYVTSGYPPFLAEIASTTNEKLFSDYMIAHAKSDDERLYLLSLMAERIRTTIYRQALFAEFELLAHQAAEKGTPLTAAFLDRTYADLIRAYYGPEFAVDPDDGMEWGYIHHFYYKYYVFSYATGLSAGIALAEKVKAEGAPARDAYLGMLKSGCSRPPLETLRAAGVDMTKPQPIEAAARAFDHTLDEMEKILARRQKK